MIQQPHTDLLSRTHLCVGGTWRHHVQRVLLHRFHHQLANAPRDVAGSICLIAADPRAQTRSSVIPGHTLDLLTAVPDSGDALANLRHLLVAMASEHSIAVAATIDDTLRAHVVVTPEGAAGPTIRVRFATTHRRWFACWVLAEMSQHALGRGLPPPHVRSRSIERPFVGDARAAQCALEDGTVRVEDLVVFLQVQTDADWRPYATQGLVPDLGASHRDAAIALELAELSAQPSFQSGDPEAIQQLAIFRADQRMWGMAIERARGGAPIAAGVSSHTLIAGLCERPETEELGKHLKELLGGSQPVPTWWAGANQVVALSSHQGMRTAVLVESIAAAAADRRRRPGPTLLLVDAELLIQQQPARLAVEHLLRSGRKHQCCVVLLCEAYDPELKHLLDFCPTWLIDAKDTTFPRPQRLDPRPDAAAGSAATGWCQHSDARYPAPLGSWFTTEEVVAGDRLLCGVSHA